MRRDARGRRDLVLCKRTQKMKSTKKWTLQLLFLLQATMFEYSLKSHRSERILSPFIYKSRERPVMSCIPRFKPMQCQQSQDEIQIFTDGACSNNGCANARASIGVYFPQGQYSNVSETLQGSQTNNTAELEAIVRALEIVKEDAMPVLIYSDSDYCIKGITGVNKRHKNVELMAKVDTPVALRKSRNSSTAFRWVKGHTGLQDGNAFADRLANDALTSDNGASLKRKREEEGEAEEEPRKAQKASSCKETVSEVSEKSNSDVCELELLNLYRRLTELDRRRMMMLMQCFVNTSQ